MFVEECNEPLTHLDGVGKKTSHTLSQMGINSIADLILFKPRKYENRCKISSVASLVNNSFAYVKAKVIKYDFFGPPQRKTLKVILRDESGFLSLLCFGRSFLKDSLLVGFEYHIYGQFSFKFGEWQCSIFDYEKDSEGLERFGKVLPVYPLSEGLTQNFMRKLFKQLYAKIELFDDEIPSSIRQKYSLIPKSLSLKEIHLPSSYAALNAALSSLKFDELFVLQVSLLQKQQLRQSSEISSISCTSKIMEKAMNSLPFSLTEDQLAAISEIYSDLESNRRMNRLLQGDVGSGKTLVAFLTVLCVLQNGQQAAFMAPTELLARQHAETAAALMEPLGFSVAFLSSNIKAKAKKLLLEALRRGEIDFLIGTHALFSRDVDFYKLEYVIIDEQHKFGVEQRSQFFEKGELPHVLLMTATPIPRSLTMSLFGDLSTSIIRSMPKGRKNIRTHLASVINSEKVYSFVRNELANGHQAYFVYPLIDESESLELKNAEAMYNTLAETVFPEYDCVLIHSRLAENEKLQRMRSFSEGQASILVATSVVEVGVDVANATCMVIEHAERFGLAALHQLRGRVGRSALQSYCFLVYGENLTDSGKQRLKVMKESHDGFYIAEQDLLIRGPGNIAGKEQSGYLQFRFADLTSDLNVLKEARTAATSILCDDAVFLNAENSVLRRYLDAVQPFQK